MRAPVANWWKETTNRRLQQGHFDATPCFPECVSVCTLPSSSLRIWWMRYRRTRNGRALRIMKTARVERRCDAQEADLN